MAADSEIIALLREIRDLQRAQFEHSKVFRESAVQRADEARKAREESVANLARTREENRQYQDQIQRDISISRQSIRRSQRIAWILNGVLILAVLYLILTSQLHWLT